MKKEYGNLEQDVLDRLNPTIEKISSNLGMPVEKVDGKYHARSNKDILASSGMSQEKAMQRTLKPSGQAGVNSYFEEPVLDAPLRSLESNDEYGYSNTLIVPSIILFVILVAFLIVLFLQYK